MPPLWPPLCHHLIAFILGHIAPRVRIRAVHGTVESKLQHLPEIWSKLDRQLKSVSVPRLSRALAFWDCSATMGST